MPDVNNVVGLIIKDTPKTGKGVFADRFFKKGETIFVFGGDFFKHNELPKPYNEIDDHYMQIDKDLYIGPSGSYDDFFNHSCDPNSGIVINGKNVKLIAIKDIEQGEEIAWDYSTTMDEGDWEMECKCGSQNCRGKIRDFKYLPDEVKKKYKDLGIVASYILDNNLTK